jgi:hypothetical protein
MGKFSSSFMYKSPLNGAYTSGADQGSTYVSNREAFQQLQDDIVTGAKEGDRAELYNKVLKGDVDIAEYNRRYPKDKDEEKENKDSATAMLGKCPKGKVRSKINKKCVSKKGAGKEYDK